MRTRNKVIISVTVILVCVIAATAIYMIYRNRQIGTVSGVENEFITIDDVRYQMTETDHSVADRGQYLGTVTNGTVTYSVYAVNNDSSGEYIYAVSGYDGEFFRKIMTGE